MLAENPRAIPGVDLLCREPPEQTLDRGGRPTSGLRAPGVARNGTLRALIWGNIGGIGAVARDEDAEGLEQGTALDPHCWLSGAGGTCSNPGGEGCRPFCIPSVPARRDSSARGHMPLQLVDDVPAHGLESRMHGCTAWDELRHYVECPLLRRGAPQAGGDVLPLGVAIHGWRQVALAAEIINRAACERM